MSDQKKIVIIGGGLAGLIAGIRLARKDVECTLIEKKTYPFHRVCGEYISNETEDFLKREGLYPQAFNPPRINQLQLSAVSGKDISLPLTLGGFGVSRYAYDNFLYEIAKQSGVKFLLQTEVRSVTLNNSFFEVSTDHQTLEADLLIGAFGKRSRLDVQLSRGFVKKRSPYVGVKYHLRTDQPANRISLHNFAGGYCGISNIEGGKTNMCYLTHRDNIKRFGSIEEMEKNVLFKNPHLQSIFNNSEFLFPFHCKN